MMPGMNPRQMQKMMQKMGIRQEEIKADEVIIRQGSENLIIRNPQVTKVNMMGQETFQIVGEISKESVGLSEEDINTVMEQANVSRDKAKKALEETNGDLAEAILKLS